MSARSVVKHSLLKGVVSVLGAGMLVCVVLIGASSAQTLRAAGTAGRVWVKPHSTGGLDCNGFSRIQQTVASAKACTDIRGIAGIDNKNTWGGRFYDNGHYIGHDEPDARYLSSAPGSGDNVFWNETLGRDPAGAPTVKTPARTGPTMFELTIAPWFSMALCDPFSYPQLPCTAEQQQERSRQRERPRPAGCLPGRRQLVPGDAVLPAGHGPLRRQHQLRQHPLVRRRSTSTSSSARSTSPAATPAARRRRTSPSSRPTVSPPAPPARS